MTITAVQRAFLDSIAAGEAPDYNVIYGGGTFDSYADHPRKAVPIRSGPNAGKYSSAAGRYQFLRGTWNEAKNALGLPDFSPESQDKAAVWLAGRDYKKATGRDLWSDVEAAAGDPQKLNEIGSKLSRTWTSLPGGLERNKATAGFGQRVATELSAQSKRSDPTAWGAVPVDDGPAAWGAVPVDEAVAAAPAAEGTSPLQAALSPITSYPETYSQMRQESEAQMGRGVGQLKTAMDTYAPGELLKGIGNVAMGGLGYVASPVNAALRTVVGQPVENVTGIPKEVTEFATSLALPMPKRLPVPASAPPRVVTAGDEAVMAAQNLSRTSGVDVNLPRAVASDSIVANQAGRTVANVPIAGAPLRRAGEELTGSLDEAATAVRGAYGPGDMASAGAAARTGIEESLKSGPFKQKVTALYNAVDSHVNPAVTAPMPNTKAIRDAIAARRANAGLPDSKAADGLEEALNRGGMNYQGIKDLRTFYGEMIDGNIPIPQGMTDNEVRQIYGALSKDMRLIIAKAGGPKGLAAFEKANREAARWAKVRETLMPLLKVRNDEGIVSRIMAAASSSSRADIKLLGRVRGAVGAQKWDEISSAILESMLHPPGGAYGQGAVPASFDKFVTAYNKLSDHGKQMLFRSTNHTPHADAIDDIAKIATRIKSHNQYANPSGTGQSVMTGAGVFGALADPFTTAGAFLGANVLARVLAKPATARSMAAWSRAFERYVLKQTPANRRGYENASRLFAVSVGTELSRSDVVPTLTRQLQGAIPGRADEEQQ